MAKNGNGTTTWFIHARDAATNSTIARLLPPEDACPDIQCSDKEHRNLWRARRMVVGQLERSKNHLGLEFQIFVQHGKFGAVRPWPFQNGSRGRKSRRK